MAPSEPDTDATSQPHAQRDTQLHTPDMQAGTQTEPAAPPTVSPDGKFWWDGRLWQPMPGSSSATSTTTADQVAGGIGKFIVGLMLIPLALVLLALVLTSPSALLAMALIGGVVAVFLWRRRAGTPKP